jgi:hypothetical protein
VRLQGLRVRRGGPPGDLVVVVTLPDGRRLQTLPQHGNWARLESMFAVAANSYDNRTVTARVLRVVARPGQDVPPLELGTVAIRLSDLLAQRAVVLADGAVDELRVDVVPANLPPGEVRGLMPLPEPPPPRPAPKK